MPSLDENSKTQTPTRATCPLCETPLDPAHPNECPRCDWVSGYRRRQTQRVGSGRDLTAVVLSVIPGLGHFYKGQHGAAVVAFVGALVAIFAALVAATATMGLAVVLIPFYWAAVMLHVFWADDVQTGGTSTTGTPLAH